MIFLIIILIFHIFLLSSLTFTAWPELFSYPYLLSHGFSLYKEIIMPYTPGLVFLNFLIFNLLGYSPFVLKILTWLLVLTADVLIYLILSKITYQKTTIFFLIVFVLLQSFFDGNMLWFDLASLVPILIATLFLVDYLKSNNSKKLLFIGLALCTAIFIKQIAVVFYLGFITIFVITSFGEKKFIKNMLILLGSSLLIFVPFIFYLLINNILNDFVLWSIYYPFQYWSNFPGYVDLEITKGRIFVGLLIVIPISFLFLKLRDLIQDKLFLYVLTFFIASVLTIYPRFSYFHLQPLIAIFIILSSIIFMKFERKLKMTFLAVFLICITNLLIIFWDLDYIGDSIRFYNQKDINISHFIDDKISRDENVFLLGLPSSYYVFSNTLPPKPWADNFGWYLEIPGVQEKIIEGFRKDAPKLVFWKRPIAGEWFELGSYRPQKITDYIRNNYQKIDNINSEIEIWQIKK